MFTDSIWLYLGGGLVLAVAAVPLARFLFGRVVLPGLASPWFRGAAGVVAKLLDRISPGLDLKLLVRAGNRYFRSAFIKAPVSKRLLFLPVCLCPRECPAQADPECGLKCQGDCPGCQVGQLRNEALGMGYGQVYVVPSSRLKPNQGLKRSDEFIRAKIREHAPLAALGVVCGVHLRRRLMPKHRVSGAGYAAGPDRPASALQGVLLCGRNCLQASVDWDHLRRLMHQGVLTKHRLNARKA